MLTRSQSFIPSQYLTNPDLTLASQKHASILNSIKQKNQQEEYKGVNDKQISTTQREILNGNPSFTAKS